MSSPGCCTAITLPVATDTLFAIDGGANNAVAFNEVSGSPGTFAFTGPAVVNAGDTLDFSDLGAGLSVNLTVGTFGNVTTGDHTIATVNAGTAAADSTIESVTGTASADNVLGDSADNVLSGGDGADTLNGANGDDLLFGGSGNDDLTGGNGDDVLVGGDGADSLNGADGLDTFVFGGSDTGVDGIDAFNINDDVLAFDSTIGGRYEELAGGATFDVVVSDVSGAANNYNVGTFGVPTFVLDATLQGGQQEATLWFDPQGDGTAEFQITTFDGTSLLGGFDEDSFTVF